MKPPEKSTQKSQIQSSAVVRLKQVITVGFPTPKTELTLWNGSFSLAGLEAQGWAPMNHHPPPTEIVKGRNKLELFLLRCSRWVRGTGNISLICLVAWWVLPCKMYGRGKSFLYPSEVLQWGPCSTLTKCRLTRVKWREVLGLWASDAKELQPREEIDVDAGSLFYFPQRERAGALLISRKAKNKSLLPF